MNVNVEKLEGSRAKLTITVDSETFAKARDAAYKKNKNKISMPGFRKGKVPRKMIERMYGKGVFDDDAINMAAPDAYEEAIKDTDLEIISAPEFDIVEITDSDEFVFDATVAVKPEVKLLRDYSAYLLLVAESVVMVCLSGCETAVSGAIFVLIIIIYGSELLKIMRKLIELIKHV